MVLFGPFEKWKIIISNQGLSQVLESRHDLALAPLVLDKMPEKCHPGGFEKSCGVEGRFSLCKKIVTTEPEG